MPNTFLRAGTKPKKSQKIYLLFLFLLLIRFFHCNFYACFPVHFPPRPAKGARDSEVFAEDQQTPVFNYSGLRE